MPNGDAAERKEDVEEEEEEEEEDEDEDEEEEAGAISPARKLWNLNGI